MFNFDKRVLFVLDQKYVFGFQNEYIDVIGNIWILGVNIGNQGENAMFGYFWVTSVINDKC